MSTIHLCHCNFKMLSFFTFTVNNVGALVRVLPHLDGCGFLQQVHGLKMISVAWIPHGIQRVKMLPAPCVYERDPRAWEGALYQESRDPAGCPRWAAYPLHELEQSSPPQVPHLKWEQQGMAWQSHSSTVCKKACSSGSCHPNGDVTYSIRDLEPMNNLRGPLGKVCPSVSTYSLCRPPTGNRCSQLPPSRHI